MNKENISLCKLLNFLFLCLLLMCASPLFFYGLWYNQFIIVFGIAGYGITLRWVGTSMDKVLEW